MKKVPIKCLEIEKAIAKSKSNRAPGEDRIIADMLKADPSMSAKGLVGLFNKVWTEEKVPDAWIKGILIKLPKKGDLSQCNNWRGINLLSVTGKIFCLVILYRIKSSVDKALREEQAGFCEGRYCIDQIFIMCTIIEQPIEWNCSIYIDFEKNFDSVHHKNLWKILQAYEIP
ncbi:LINE-1 retrotransposable element ORF2 protein [Elysia marginata]|uniref:LINE-1 retrotransposable element ORF2 protein n=1 Tax=Elysia marginata TaxID=1093978 RepID=A0AAV4IKL2_9GAST|nr:LINE-1 retrotransposable element ORF2 protein [Elysia marginata]